MSKELPKISIVTPSYNQGLFLEDCIRSVITQDYPNLEYIIIDGGSTDGSQKIIERYEKQLHYWISEPDGGQYDALNKGFSLSSGEIMAWLNADDMYYPWTFRTIADVMSALPGVDWVTTLNPGGWDYHGFCTGFRQIPGFSREGFLDGCYIPFDPSQIGWIQQESTFWRRRLWNISGKCLNTKLELASDFELWCRFYHVTELYGINIPLGGFRLQHLQRSRKKDLYIQEAYYALSLLRQNMDWKPSLLRDSARRLNIRKIPKIRNIFIHSLGYSGKRIERNNLDQPGAYWYIKSYKF